MSDLSNLAIMASAAPVGTFTVLYFASASSFTGKDSDCFPAPVALSDLYALLEDKYPGIRASTLDHSMLTVNLEYVDVPASDSGETGMMIESGFEVAIIPAVSSG